MDIEIVNNIHTDENTYIVYKNGGAVVIDPGSDAETIIAKTEELGLKTEYILITHSHYDHILGLENLRQKTGAKLVCGEKASENIGNPLINLSAQALNKSIAAKPADIILSDGEEINLCGMNITAIHTPGHTDCGMCYLIDGELFSGDTLFLRSIGRTDFPNGNHTELVNSIKTKLYTLGGGVKVFPGHGRETSIGYEKKFNLFVTAD